MPVSHYRALSVASKNDLDDQNLLLATVCPMMCILIFIFLIFIKDDQVTEKFASPVYCLEQFLPNIKNEDLCQIL
jgi:hypothetical protein